MTVATAAAAPPDAIGLIRRRLRAVRRRWWARSFARGFVVSAPLAACAALGWGAFCLLTDRPVLNGMTAAILLGGTVFLSLFSTFGRNTSVLSLKKTARWTDHFTRTHDRFHTALTLSERPAAARTPVEELALAECTRFIGKFDVRAAIPVSFRGPWWSAIFPLVSLGMLVLYAALGVGRPPHDPALDAAVNRRAEALEKIADRLRRQDNPTNQPELDKLADAMKKSAEHLKQSERANDEDRLKTALKELSSLEAMLNAMKQAQHDNKTSPQELAALAAALAANEQTRAAAESLKNGDLEKAAAQLEQLLQQLKQQGNDTQALQQLAQSMQEQAAKLTEQEKNEIARQMEQAAQGAQSSQPQLSQQALQRLADLLRKAGKSGAGKSGQQQVSSGKAGGQPMTEKQLQDLINALENMKQGMQPGGEGPQGPPQDGPGSQQALSLVESFSKSSGDPKPGDQPGGMPGSEHDAGHPEKLYADKPGDAAKAGNARRLEGLLGEGESLQELTAAGAGSPARAGQRYRALYEAMAPAAQQSVEQENIPLGSRFYIQRYFENIRPKE